MKIRQEIAFGMSVSSTGDLPYLRKINPADFTGGAFYLEVAGIAPSATVTVSLRRQGSGTTDASIVFTNESDTKKSASFTPPSGDTTYYIHVDVTGLTIARVCIVVEQDSADIQNTQRQVAQFSGVSGLTNTTDNTGIGANVRFWKHVAAAWDAGTVFSAEVAYLTSNSMGLITITLQEDDGSLGGWTDKVTVLAGGSATTLTLTARTTYTPVDGRHYRFVSRTSNSMYTYEVWGGALVATKTGGVVKTEALYTFSEASQGASTVVKALFSTGQWDAGSGSIVYKFKTQLGAGTAAIAEFNGGTPLIISGSTNTGGTPQYQESGALTLPNDSIVPNGPNPSAGIAIIARYEYSGAATYTGTGAGTLAAVTGAATATYAPTFTGTGAGTLAAITGESTATYTDPVYTGTGVGTLAAITGESTATYTDPVYTGTGVGTLAAVTSAATATFEANLLPTVALNVPADLATGVSVTPTFTFTGTDPNTGDTLEYNIQVDTVNTFNSQP